MAKMLFELMVEMDDAEPYVVVADQRDIAKWEVHPDGWPIAKIEDKVSMLFFRYLAWSASLRERRVTAVFDVWSTHCIEVMPVDDEESALPADAEDPGPTVP